MAMDMFQEYTSPHLLFRRCVQCPNVSPSCPQCASDEICSQITQSCQQCASATCVKADESGATNNGSVSSSGGGPNIGAIAGGVVGGVVFIVIAAFLIWKFCLKGRRRPITEDYEFEQEKDINNDFGMHRSARASTHTVQSMASTVLTRASNIIQIAYIPGVTNRSTASPGLLVPPVPPIPSATTNSSLYRDTTNSEDQVFFTAGDIRDSTYSGMTGYSDVDARTSIAPSLARSSVATTIYRSQAQVSPLPAPTQTMIRGKAAVVSVNKGHSSSASSATNTPMDTPPVPQIDFAKHSGSQSSSGPRTVQVKMPASTDQLGGPSPSNSVRTVTIGAKVIPVNVKRPGMGNKKSSSDKVPVTTSIAEAVSKAASESPKGLGVRHISGASHERANRIEEVATEDESSDEEVTEHERSRRSLLGNDRVESLNTLQSPFGDSNRVPSAEVTPTLGNMQGKGKQRAEEEEDEDEGRNQSPFEDSHAVP